MIRALITIGTFLCFSTMLYAEDAAVSAPNAQASASDVSAPSKKRGAEIFSTICSHCHRTDSTASSVGAPGLKDVITRHAPEWIDQWLTSPEAFSKIDPAAKALTEGNKYGLIMPTFPEMQDPMNRKDVIEFLKTL